MNTLKPLTAKEEEVLEMFWANGPRFVRELVDSWLDPKPHFNTVSTMVRSLEEKGYVGHEAFGKTYRYHAIVTPEQVGTSRIGAAMKQYFSNSAMRMVSSLVSQEQISADELRRLLDEIEKSHS